MELCDIIIIGTVSHTFFLSRARIYIVMKNTSPDAGLAAQYIGRVRKDGLIVMLRDGVS
jgi:hypothetical protein